MSSPQITRESPLPFTRPLASLKCSVCEVQNRAERQYCASCGARLWEPCVRCGRANAASEQHCGDCGAHLDFELAQAKAAIGDAVREAMQLAADGHHPQAIERLQNLSLPDHSRLAAFHHEVPSRLAEMRGQMLRANRQRDEAIMQGRALLAACDYEQAAILLERVAEPYRTDEFCQLLDEIRGRQVEMLTLAADIRRAMNEKCTEGLLGKVQELLRLKPDHEQARLLLERLRPLEQKRKRNDRDTLYQSAQVQLARHDYAAALQQLRLIPVEVRTPQLVKLINDTDARAEESAWLRRDVFEAVVYDDHLLPIAVRLQKLHPNDQELATLIAHLGDCAVRKAQTGKGDWPRPHLKSIWGPPLETISAFRSIDTTSLEKVTCFQERCDHFCAAAGLALQGLKKTRLDVNLVRPEKTRLLNRLRANRKPTTAWGIDVGRAAIKAIRLKCVEDYSRIVAEAAEYLEYSTPLNAPNAEPDLLAKTLDTFLKRDDIRDAVICVGLPAYRVLYRPVLLPLVDKKKLAQIMNFEIRQQVPFAIDQVVWGYQALGSRATDFRTVQEWDVSLFAVKRDDGNSAVAPFNDRGLKVHVLASDAAALFNFWEFESGAKELDSGTSKVVAGGNSETDHRDSVASNHVTQPEPDSEPVTAVLDVGTDSSNVIITNGRSLHMRSIPLGGNSFSRTMVNEFKLTFEQAEKIKRNPLAVRELHRLYGALDPRFADLSRELARTIDAFIQVHPARRLARFIVVGGGLKLHGALRRLWHGQ